VVQIEVGFPRSEWRSEHAILMAILNSVRFSTPQLSP
jgi:hypothetical protein